MRRSLCTLSSRQGHRPPEKCSPWPRSQQQTQPDPAKAWDASDRRGEPGQDGRMVSKSDLLLFASGIQVHVGIQPEDQHALWIGRSHLVDCRQHLPCNAGEWRGGSGGSGFRAVASG